MLERGILDAKQDPDHPSDANLYWLKANKNVHWLTGENNRRHEVGCMDIFVALKPWLKYWDNGWSSYEIDNNIVPKFQAQYDRRAILDGVRPWLLFEFERGTKEIFSEDDRHKISKERWSKSLNGKIDAYEAFAKAHPEISFRVPIICKERLERKYPRVYDDLALSRKLADDTLNMLYEREAAPKMFPVALLQHFKQDPMGKIFAVATDVAEPKPVSLRDL
jgi:hypothetical protein